MARFLVHAGADTDQKYPDLCINRGVREVLIPL